MADSNEKLNPEELQVVPPKKSRLKKWQKITLYAGGGLAALLIIFIVLRNILLPVIIENAGSFITGVPVKIGYFHAGFNGDLEIRDFQVGNPAGFKEQPLLKVDAIKVKVEIATLFEPEMIIDHIIVKGVQVTYEINPKGDSNIATVQSNINRLAAPPSAETAEAVDAEPETPQESKPQQSLLIRLLDIGYTKIIFDSYTLNSAVNLPMPPIYLTNLGGSDSSITETISQVTDIFVGGINSITAGVNALNAAGTQLTDSVHDATRETGKSLNDLGKSLGESGKNFLKSLKQISK